MVEIIKQKLVWLNGKTAPTPQIAKTKIDGIALHHMAHPTWTFDDVHKYHRDTHKWQGIAYGWWIDYQGNIYEGRGFAQNAGTKDHGSHLLDIGFQGNYEPTEKMKYLTEMPDAQFNAGVDLIKWLMPQLPNLRVIHGHKHWTATACPGKYFPLVEMVSLKKRGEQVVQKLTDFKDVPAGHYAEISIAKADRAGVLKGVGPGTFGVGQTVTREQLAVILDRLGMLE